MEQLQQIIEHYINSYNSFDTEGMIRDIDADVVFESISNGQVDLKINGIEDFKKQVELAKGFFKQRHQEIVLWNFDMPKVSIDIHYHAVLAIDLPNGMKGGEALNLKGKSEFVFDRGKIKTIRDIIKDE